MILINDSTNEIENNNKKPFVKWVPSMMCEVILKDPEHFLMIKETLTRMGIAAKQTNDLWQSCHILFKRGKYYIVHFKEMFALDGKIATLTDNDVKRRNTIARLLHEWGLLELKTPIQILDTLPLKEVKIISNNDKGNWNLKSKYSIGRKK